MAQSTIHVTSKRSDDNEVLCEYSEEDVEFNDSQYVDTSVIQSPESSLQDFTCSSPLISIPSHQRARGIADPSCSQSAPPQSQTPTRRYKQKRNDDPGFSVAIQVIAETLKEHPAPQPPTDIDPVDACMNFLGSMLKTLNSKILQIDVLNDLVQTVLAAKSKDL